eukprot:355040-Chlamydomonas_euryale.AAC.4
MIGRGKDWQAKGVAGESMACKRSGRVVEQRVEHLAAAQKSGNAPHGAKAVHDQSAEAADWPAKRDTPGSDASTFEGTWVGEGGQNDVQKAIVALMLRSQASMRTIRRAHRYLHACLRANKKKTAARAHSSLVLCRAAFQHKNDMLRGGVTLSTTE